MKTLLIIFTALLVILGIFAAVVRWNQTAFLRMAREEAVTAFDNAVAETHPITADQLDALPEPVRRYLEHCGVIGKTPVNSVRLKMLGSFRTSPDQSFFDMQAEEYYTINPPSLIWLGDIKMAPMMTVAARDKYANGRGTMWIKLLSTFTIENAIGEHMDNATLMRYLNEMVWFPTAYLGDNMAWEAINDSSARVSITDRGRTVSAEVFFNDKGEMINFKAPRFCSYTKKDEIWTTPFRDYKEIDGLRIPTGGEGVWKLESGDYEYIRLDITNIEYNVNEPF